MHAVSSMGKTEGDSGRLLYVLPMCYWMMMHMGCRRASGVVWAFEGGREGKEPLCWFAIGCTGLDKGCAVVKRPALCLVCCVRAEGRG